MSLIPKDTSISIQNNPFSPYRSEFCIININVPEHTIRADVKIFDIKGRHVINLGDKTTVPGEYSFIWHGLDSSGRPVSPGIYPVSITIDNMNGKNITSTKKVIYVAK
jgi:flagellar hook assembly protein FlgD